MKLVKWAGAAFAGAMMMAAPGNAEAAVVLDQLSFVTPPPPISPYTRVNTVATIGAIPQNTPSPYAGMRTGTVQTITAGTRGKLSSVAFSTGPAFLSGTLIISLIDGDYTAGARSVIGQSYVDFANISPAGSPNILNQIFDTSQFNYTVSSGKKFSVLFDTTAGTTGFTSLSTGYADLSFNSIPPTAVNVYFSNYSGGQLARLLNGTLVTSSSPIIEDITFATYVDTSGGVPEPATWALMILGFGGIGTVLRRRTKRALALTSA